MIHYAITAGNHDRFLKRDRDSSAHSISAPLPSHHQSGFLPFPPRICLLDQARRLAHVGVDYIQLREKHLPAADLAALARQLLKILDEIRPGNGRPTRLLINGRLDVAAATGAHGVHLTARPGGITPAQVHLLYRSIGLPRPLVSLACHTLPEIHAARSQQPDLILFSPIFGKSIEQVLIRPATGLEPLTAACALAHPIPVLALGGVTPANTPACLLAGAAGVAGIRLFQS